MHARVMPRAVSHRVVTAVLTSLILTVAGSVAAVGADAPAPRPGAPGIGDPSFPLDGNGGYDVLHYSLDVGYSPTSRVLTGSARIRATSTQPLSRFDLDLDGLVVDAVRVDGADATWTRRGQELQVTPRHALPRAHTFTTVVRYHGTPKLFLDPAGGVKVGAFPTRDGALIVGEPHVAATWFPVNDHPLDKATYDISLTVPRDLQAVSNGRLRGVRRHGALSTWHWAMSKPMASYLATAGLGHFDLRTRTVDGVRYLDAVDPRSLHTPLPRTGGHYVLSGGAESGYQRLTRRFVVPAAGGRLTFHVARSTEAGYDFFAVEAHRVGTATWTTLPDLNGHTATDPFYSCPYWLSIHPFLTHYESDDGAGGCRPTGSTGTWNAAFGQSEGYETWSVDLSAYAGRSVDLSLSVITDDFGTGPGAWVDDIVGPGGQGTTSFESDGNTLDGWTVPGPPTTSPGNTVDWHVATSDPRVPEGVRAQAALDQQPAFVRFLTGYFGPYPFRDGGGIVDFVPTMPYALEAQSRSVYSSRLFIFGTADDDDEIVVHELTHQWTGDSLSLSRWQDIWLNEGFASYAVWLWSEHQGRATVQENFDSFAAIPADDPFWQVETAAPGNDNLFSAVPYYRGAMTLQALRLEIGDPAFFRLLRRWTALHAYGNVTTRQFIALAEKVSGQDLGAFFTTWLYSASKPPGLPESKQRASAGATRAEQLVRHSR